MTSFVNFIKEHEEVLSHIYPMDEGYPKFSQEGQYAAWDYVFHTTPYEKHKKMKKSKVEINFQDIANSIEGSDEMDTDTFGEKYMISMEVDGQLDWRKTKIPAEIGRKIFYTRVWILKDFFKRVNPTAIFSIPVDPILDIEDENDGHGERLNTLSFTRAGLTVKPIEGGFFKITKPKH